MAVGKARKLLPPEQRGAPEPAQPTRRLARRLEPPTGLSQGAGQNQQVGLARTEIERPLDPTLTASTGVAQRRAVGEATPPVLFPVTDSSRVQEMGYQPETQTVFVTFRDGTPWQYRQVPPQIWDEFKSAESPGRFINQVLDEFPYGRDTTRGRKAPLPRWRKDG